MKRISKQATNRCKLAFLLMLICFLTTGCAIVQFVSEVWQSSYVTTKTDMVKWAEQNSDTWQKAIASPPLHEKITPEDGELWAQLYEDKRIVAIWYDLERDQYIVYFNNPSDAKGETSVSFIYKEGVERITEVSSDIEKAPNEILTYETETSCRWDGGGANGKGYEIIENVLPDWYYSVEYCPT